MPFLGGEGKELEFLRFGRRAVAGQFDGRCRWLRRGFQKVLKNGSQDYHLTQRPLGSYHRHMLTHLSENWLNQVFPAFPRWPIAYKAFAYHSSDPDRAAQDSRLAEFECHLPYVL